MAGGGAVWPTRARIDTVCIRLCDAGPLYSSLLRNHIQIIIWGVSPQYHRTCGRLWSRYLHRLQADALQAKGAKAYRDGVCQQRHQANDRKKKALHTLVFVLSCEEHVVLLSDGAHVILDDKPPIHRTASLFLRHPQKVHNQTSVLQQRDHL